MKFDKIISTMLTEDITNDQYNKMKDWFDKRTNNHIKLVQKYCKKIEEYDPQKFMGLSLQAKPHDQSKFKQPELDPYLYISWDYKCKDDGVAFDIPDDINDKMNKATEHHVKTNPHHPDYHSDKEVNLINRADRDKPPAEIIDATKMPILDVAEMVADWCAMGEEKGTQPKSWANKNVNIRWKFTPKQTKLIYELIQAIF